MGIVYKILNLVNGMFYVGKTTQTLLMRWYQHKSRARHAHRNHYLYNAMRKYGIDNFTIEVLESGIPEENLDAREIAWIAELKAADSNVGYNCSLGGEGAKHGPSSKARQKGWRTFSTETREKIGAAHRGRKHSPEHVEKMRLNLIGKKQNPEAVANRAASLRVAFEKPEVKDKLSKVAVKRCADGNRFWEKQTRESIDRARESRRKWFDSPEGLEFRKRISERHKGKQNTGEALKRGWETRRSNPEKLALQRERMTAAKKVWWSVPENKERMRAKREAKKTQNAA